MPVSPTEAGQVIYNIAQSRRGERVRVPPGDATGQSRVSIRFTRWRVSLDIFRNAQSSLNIQSRD